MAAWLYVARRAAVAAVILAIVGLAYMARDRDSEAVYEVNLARLQCSCPELRAQRAGFPP
jgi:hypothetical protein